VRNALLFVGVSLSSGFGGSAMSLVATVWVLALTGSGALGALAGLCVYLPTLFGPVLGAVVDRLPRRRLLISTSLILAAGLLTLLTVRSREDLWLLYAVMLGYGVNYVLNDAAESALLPAAVGTQLLGRLNGWRMSAQESMKLVAPLAGAGLFAWQGGAAVAVVCAVALAVSAGFYALIRPREEVAPHTQEQGGGLRFLWAHRGLRSTVLVASVSVAMSGFMTAVQLDVVTGMLGRPAEFLGVLASLQGSGAILGGLLAGRVMDRLGEARFGVLGAVLFTVGLVGRSLPWLPGVIAGAVVAGVGLPWTVVAAMTAIQRATPAELLGRVSAGGTTLIFAPLTAAIPAGSGLLAVADYRLVVLLAVCLLGYAMSSALRAVGPAGGAARPCPAQPPAQSLEATEAVTEAR
jgi:MFS family permease